MDDYISRQAALDKLKKTVAVIKNPNHNTRIWEEGMNCAITIIGALPSTDAVEVVRCKDCKYYYYADNRIPSERGWACTNDGCYASPNDYCSWGERKDG